MIHFLASTPLEMPEVTVAMRMRLRNHSCHPAPSIDQWKWANGNKLRPLLEAKKPFQHVSTSDFVTSNTSPICIYLLQFITYHIVLYLVCIFRQFPQVESLVASTHFHFRLAANGGALDSNMTAGAYQMHIELPFVHPSNRQVQISSDGRSIEILGLRQVTDRSRQSNLASMR